MMEKILEHLWAFCYALLMTQAATSLPPKISQLQQMVVARDQEISLLREQLRLLRAKLFGSKRDRLEMDVLQDQLMLFEQAEAEPGLGEEDSQQADQETEVPSHRRRKPGRKPLPADLPRSTRA